MKVELKTCERTRVLTLLAEFVGFRLHLESASKHPPLKYQTKHKVFSSLCSQRCELLFRRDVNPLQENHFTLPPSEDMA